MVIYDFRVECREGIACSMYRLQRAPNKTCSWKPASKLAYRGLSSACPCQEVHPVSRVDKKSNARSRVSFPALNFRGPESNCRPAEVQQLKVCLS
jgi:hypothetical protein